MEPFYVATWNVLHRYHEENHNPDSEILKKYHYESDRINATIKLIDKTLNQHDNVILCLQEVSGDLMEAINNKFHSFFAIIQFKYERVPQKKNKGFNIYKNPKEYLIILISKSFRVHNNKKVKYTTPGKGALIIFLDELIIVNTHLTIPKADKGDLEQKVLKYLLPKYKLPIVVAGDFNRSREKTINDLKSAKIHNERIEISDASALNKFTYPVKKVNLDQIIGIDIAIGAIDIIDSESTSDHNILLAKINL